MARGQKRNSNGKGKRHATQQSVDRAVESIRDTIGMTRDLPPATWRQSVDRAVDRIFGGMRRGNCAGAVWYAPELTGALFLRILDE